MSFYHTNIPGIGRWFGVCKDLFSAYEKLEDKTNTLLIAWDKNCQGSKSYGLMSSTHQYLTCIQSMPTTKRCAYELISEGNRCKLYLDVEWNGKCADPYQRVLRLCAIITNRVQSVWKSKDKVLFYINTSSRLKIGKNGEEDIFRNSYHVVCPNVIFANNNDMQMQNFVRSLAQNDICDLLVYTKNRCVRTELCSKFGQDSPFKKVLADGTIVENVLNFNTAEQIADFEKGLITKVDHNLPIFQFLTGSEFGQKKRKRDNKKIILQSERNGKDYTNLNKATTFKQLIPHYFEKIFINENSSIELKDVNPNVLPRIVFELLQLKKITLSDIFPFYIRNPAKCVSAWLEGKDHIHHNNNASAIMLRLDHKVEVYIRCFCCDKYKFSRIKKETKYGSMPVVNDFIRSLVQSTGGLDSVLDTVDRTIVKKIYEMNREKRRNELMHPHNKLMWTKYIITAASGWILVSENRELFTNKN